MALSQGEINLAAVMAAAILADLTPEQLQALAVQLKSDDGRAAFSAELATKLDECATARFTPTPEFVADVVHRICTNGRLAGL